VICKGNVCQFYCISTAQLEETAQNISQRSSCSTRCHCFQLGTILCFATEIIMYIPVSMMVYSDVVLHRGLPWVCAHPAQRTTSRTGRNKILNGHVGWHSRKQITSCRPDCENITL